MAGACHGVWPDALERCAPTSRWIPLPDPSPKIPDLEVHDFDWTDQAIEGRMPKFFLSYAPMPDRAS